MKDKRTHTGQMYQQATEDQTYTPSWRTQRPAEKEGRSPTVFKPSQ